MRALMIAAFALAAAPALASQAPVRPVHINPPVVHRLCAIGHPCGRRCPKGEWRCNGRCIPDNQICRLVP